jgi:ATP-dependent Clp protease adaptor protein ClpS
MRVVLFVEYYPYEVAETKVMQVINFAKQNQYPLKCIMKKSI